MELPHTGSASIDRQDPSLAVGTMSCWVLRMNTQDTQYVVRQREKRWKKNLFADAQS